MKVFPVASYRRLLAVGLLALASSTASLHAAPPPEAPRPILLELFTSEGCWSCPPADRLLEVFDRMQPVSGANLIVLSEHVDYWNHLGWADPFSAALFTERQQDYVARLHLASAYTPELVIDGQADVVGSDESAARSAILKAAARPKVMIELSARRSAADVSVALQVKAGARGSNVFVVLAQDHARSRVTRGENSGKTLEYVAVARAFLLAGKTDAQGAFTKQLTLPLQNLEAGPCRVVVFLQNAVSKQILGVTQTRL